MFWNILYIRICSVNIFHFCIGGYYLTSAYGAMSLIKNFQEDQAARVLSSTTRDTLHQWHQRRTMPKNLPSVDDFQVSPWPSKRLGLQDYSHYLLLNYIFHVWDFFLTQTDVFVCIKKSIKDIHAQYKKENKVFKPWISFGEPSL